MASNKFTSFIMFIILLVTFLGLINMIFSLHRFAFYGEMIVLLIFFIIAIVAVVGMNNRFKWSWTLFTILFGLMILNNFFLKSLLAETPSSFLHLSIIALVGFLIPFFKIDHNSSNKEKKPAVIKTFKPGKFIASKSGTKYHAPKCDWAKRIKKKNEVWFNTKEQAKKAGYKADVCLK